MEAVGAAETDGFNVGVDVGDTEGGSTHLNEMSYCSPLYSCPFNDFLTFTLC
eukprot:CAMPEP_0196818512 /NCGR_PEP_ID=MMETSP1362-20130617/65937_1 /TAXON_ID=163516 /ORGANISM="Leptocylindrus danicus, Strain CCMP1856" /LENGTH=51 /DNA_ID=CAMNT_0042196635 /DNA_START=71 /DNA_END=223 /DNA_ORIENTATION=+